MNRGSLIVSTIAATLLISGCILEKRIVWSPDGQRAAVATPNGLFFINAEGKVLEPRLSDTPTICAWFGDGRRLAVAHTAPAKNWEDVADMFSPAQHDKIKALAKDLHERVMAYEGDWDDFEPDPDDRIPATFETAAFLYLRDHLSEGLPEKLGDKWEDLKELRPNVHQLQLFTLTKDKLMPGKVLVRTLHQIYRPNVSPDDRSIAFIMPRIEAGDEDVTLHVVACENGKARSVADNVSLGHDWSPDGRCLAFIQASPSQFEKQHNVQLGSLATTRVAEENGSLLAEWEAREDLVGLLFNSMLTVRWLSDDRLLFSSYETTLPATTRDMPQQWSLFMFDPKMSASVHRILGRHFDEPLEPEFPHFELSPDERRALLLGADGQIILHDFRSGETTQLIDPDVAGGDIHTLPSWRNNKQVSLVRPIDARRKLYEVVQWEQGGNTKSLSDTWPPEMKKGWLTEE